MSLTLDRFFIEKMKENSRGDWTVYTLSDWEPTIVAKCNRCGDEISGIVQIRLLCFPGYHCWCDR